MAVRKEVKRWYTFLIVVVANYIQSIVAKFIQKRATIDTEIHTLTAFDFLKKSNMEIK